MQEDNKFDDKISINSDSEEINKNEEEKNKRNKKEGNIVLEWARSILIAVILAFVIKIYIMEPTMVKGNSMNITLQNNDRLIVDKISMKFKPLERGDIIVMRYDSNNDYIKRIIALPGEYIQIIDGRVYINGEIYEESYINADFTDSINGFEWKLGRNEYFVMGDNRKPGESSDSRVFGPISLEQVKGVARFRFYPFDTLGVIK